jgi:hypothetical protein
VEGEAAPNNSGDSKEIGICSILPYIAAKRISKESLESKIAIHLEKQKK